MQYETCFTRQTKMLHITIADQRRHILQYIGGDTEMLQTQKNVIKVYMFETDTVLQSHCIIHSVEIYELLLLLQVFQMNKKRT